MPWILLAGFAVVGMLGVVGLVAGGPSGALGMIMACVAGVGCVVLYMLPTIVACKEKHPNTAAIVACNILFGWTFIGWGIALIWAVKK
jgi:hypothetical protein